VLAIKGRQNYQCIGRWRLPCRQFSKQFSY